MWFPKDFQLPKAKFQAAKAMFQKGNESVAYNQVQGKAEEDSESENNESYAELQQQLGEQVKRQLRRRWFIPLAQAVMTISSIIFAILGFWARASNGVGTECPRCYVDDEQCTIHLSTYCKFYPMKISLPCE
jgi:hypothetical protein